MANHIQIKIITDNAQQQELLIAILSECGFDGFEEMDNCLDAYIPENIFDRSNLESLASDYHFSWSSLLIDERNWNAVWESNFSPVTVENFVGIRADFHAPINEVAYEIIITPKMSFGTGHHATTYIMMLQMKDLNIKNKTVFDFGTGTGILAILAEKLGAKSILAIDNDQWSITNAAENIQKNNCSHIELVLSDKPESAHKFDIILANINKNIILENISILTGQLEKKASLLLSGLLAEDENDIVEACKFLNLNHIKTVQKDKWICLLLTNCVS